MFTSVLIIYLVLLWVLVLVDLNFFHIPNVMVLVLFAFGLLAQYEKMGIIDASAGFMAAYLAGALLAVIGMLPGYLIGSTGAGDVKLMGAGGALLGPQGALFALLFSYLIGGAMAGAVAFRARLAGKQGPGSRYLGMVQSLVTTGRVTYVRPSEEEFMGQRFPFAFPIAAGVTLALAIQLYY